MLACFRAGGLIGGDCCIHGGVELLLWAMLRWLTPIMSTANNAIPLAVAIVN
jgi:hypothetical protein